MDRFDRDDHAYRILGVVPNGTPWKKKTRDTSEAIPQALVAGNEALLLDAAKNVILCVIGRRGPHASDINPARFHSAIRVFYPVGYYERSPNQAVSRLDEKHYACRVAHRLLNQVNGAFIALEGGYGSEEQTDVRAEAIYREAMRMISGRQSTGAQ